MTTRDISNMEDVLDVRDIIARFEELEGQRRPWRAGWNMPGYMPDSEPCGFETCAEACDYIAAEMRRADADGAKIAAALEEAAERWDSIADTEQDHGETVGDYHYWVARVPDADAFDDVSEATEYETLKELLEDLKGYGGDEQWRGDWYPITLIRDSHFCDYAEELADDIGAINSDATWPNNCIDWDRAAYLLRQDYSSVEFDGITYWYR